MHIDRFFEGIVGANLDGTRTDKAEVITLLLENYAITDRSKVVMVGDRKHDIIGAKKNSIHSCGVLWGYGSEEELKETLQKQKDQTDEDEITDDELIEMVDTMEEQGLIDEDTQELITNAIDFIDVDAIEKCIDSSIKNSKPFEEEIKRIYPAEPETVCQKCVEQSLSVSMPLFMIGFKDTDTGYAGDELLKKYIEVSIINKILLII